MRQYEARSLIMLCVRCKSSVSYSSGRRALYIVKLLPRHRVSHALTYWGSWKKKERLFCLSTFIPTGTLSEALPSPV